MNELQHNRMTKVHDARAQVRILDAQLALARAELRVAEQDLQRAIDADRESWHNTPGILK